MNRTACSSNFQSSAVRADWNSSSLSYGFGIEASSGRLHWKDLSLTINDSRLNSAVAGCGFSIESLRIASGDSIAEVAGEIKGSPALIRARANAHIDSSYGGQATVTEFAARGKTAVVVDRNRLSRPDRCRSAVTVLEHLACCCATAPCWPQYLKRQHLFGGSETAVVVELPECRHFYSTGLSLAFHTVNPRSGSIEYR